MRPWRRSYAGGGKQGLAAPQVERRALASEERVRALEIGVLTVLGREQVRPRFVERRSDRGVQLGCARVLARRGRRRRIRPEPESREVLGRSRVIGAAAVLCKQQREVRDLLQALSQQRIAEQLVGDRIRFAVVAGREEDERAEGERRREMLRVGDLARSDQCLLRLGEPLGDASEHRERSRAEEARRVVDLVPVVRLRNQLVCALDHLGELAAVGQVLDHLLVLPE